MYIDTHCHLSKGDYTDIDQVIKESVLAGVSPIIVSFCNKENMKEAKELSTKYKEVYITLGYHPEEAEKIKKEDILSLEEQLKESKVVGIGEIGLDYHYGKDQKDKQITLFEEQLQLAEKNHLPVVIHSRDATEDTLLILEKYRGKVKGIIHCFSGSLEVAKQYIKLGYYLGIGGVVTFKNSNLKKVVEQISFDNIVLETDSPYLSPEPYRGKKNSSKNIPVIAEEIAKIKGVTLQKVEEETTKNVKKIFKIKE